MAAANGNFFYLCSRENIVGDNVFYSPSLEQRREGGDGLDMGIMSLCNHTIISHGRLYCSPYNMIFFNMPLSSFFLR